MSESIAWTVRDDAPATTGSPVLWRLRLGAAHVLLQGRGAAARGTPSRSLPEGVEMAWLEQVHSDHCVEIDRPGAAGRADGLLVGRPGLAATVAAADCVPVLLAAPGRVAALHAGWRGLAAGFVGAGARRIEGAAAWIGPSIGPCCYEVGEEVAAAVVAASGEAVRRAGEGSKPHLDLALAAAAQLVAAGVREIEVLRHCTRCSDAWLESHRRDGAAAGRNLASIWLPRP